MFVILPTRNLKGGCLPLHTTLGYLVVLQGKAFAEINQMRERGCALWNRLETDHCNSLMQHIQNSCNVCSFANSGIPGAARICAVSCVFLFPRVAHGQKIIHLVAHGQKRFPPVAHSQKMAEKKISWCGSQKNCAMMIGGVCICKQKAILTSFSPRPVCRN